MRMGGNPVEEFIDLELAFYELTGIQGSPLRLDHIHCELWAVAAQAQNSVCDFRNHARRICIYPETPAYPLSEPSGFEMMSGEIH